VIYDTVLHTNQSIWNVLILTCKVAEFKVNIILTYIYIVAEVSDGMAERLLWYRPTAKKCISPRKVVVCRQLTATCPPFSKTISVCIRVVIRHAALNASFTWRSILLMSPLSYIRVVKTKDLIVWLRMRPRSLFSAGLIWHRCYSFLLNQPVSSVTPLALNKTKNIIVYKLISLTYTALQHNSPSKT